jgi:hypothetical protein
MKINCRAMRWLAGAMLALSGSGLCAQSCTLPIPFQYEFQNNVAATLAAANAADPCALNAALNSGAGPTAAGFLHYRRARATTTVRYGFRVDFSALTNFTSANHVVHLFSATSPTVLAPGVSNILDIYLVGGTQPAMRFSAAASGPSGQFVTIQSLAQTVNVVRVEINVGSGTNGLIRYWINHAFSDAPDGIIDNGGAGLDNAGWLGVIGAQIGLSSPSSAFRANHAGSALFFDQIESNDDVLFFDDFSVGAQ